MMCKIENLPFKTWELFVQDSCEKCKNLKKAILNTSIPGKIINASTNKGFLYAQQKNVFVTPLLILFDEQHNELFRLQSEEELLNLF